MSKTRTFVPCRNCGSEHRNPMSSSLCETCGPKEAEANRLREEEETAALNDTSQYDVMVDRIEELEAKLAKAVEALGCLELAATCASVPHPRQRELLHSCIVRARTTLAELTGGNQ